MPRKSLNGARLHVIIPVQQLKQLRELSRTTGMTTSEHLRRAVDQYLLAEANVGRKKAP